MTGPRLFCNIGDENPRAPGERPAHFGAPGASIPAQIRHSETPDIPGPVEVRECLDCDGSGLAPAGEHPRNGCPFCRGTGAVRVRVRP